MKQYRDLAEKLRKALDVYKERDQQASGDVRGAGGDDSGGGYVS